MLTCSSCLRDLLRAVVSESHIPLLNPTSSFFLALLPRKVRPQRRTLATIANAVEQGQRLQENDIRNRRQALGVEARKRNLHKELEYLQDPLKLAKTVNNLLRQDKLTKALDLVQLAGRDRQCTISWNHIIDYEMSKGRTGSALKIFNDVCASQSS